MAGVRINLRGSCIWIDARVTSVRVVDMTVFVGVGLCWRLPMRTTCGRYRNYEQKDSSAHAMQPKGSRADEGNRSKEGLSNLAL